MCAYFLVVATCVCISWLLPPMCAYFVLLPPMCAYFGCCNLYVHIWTVATDVCIFWLVPLATYVCIPWHEVVSRKQTTPFWVWAAMLITNKDFCVSLFTLIQQCYCRKTPFKESCFCQSCILLSCTPQEVEPVQCCYSGTLRMAEIEIPGRRITTILLAPACTYLSLES